uniref:Cyanate lyase C-terminal domain-containing protein n=1 Tax=Parascaris equorum TaxID=6256 RepID=A0A914RQC0_PAREQ
MVKSREELTNKIMIAKVEKGLTWKQVADALGQSKEWTTAACLGQMQMSKEQAEIVGKLFDLSEEGIAWLQTAPYKELIHEEFGDGIMSAIDFTLNVEREENPAGDRVKMIWS